MIRAVYKFLLGVFSIAVIVFGVVVTISPIPFGFVIVGLGLAMLAATMPAWVRGIRKRWRWFDRVIHKLERILPESLAKRLRVSDFDHGEDDPSAEESRRKNDGKSGVRRTATASRKR